ncbi:MAG: APC family permease [Chloroflexota bacterium]|nr:MAG: APC family permease [Chloroflexota bacterium]TMD85788.1 MAG: APC family permease [Chloroflexota bacterium]
MATSVEGQRLERNAVGLAPTLFQSITHMAPAAAVAFSIIVGVPYAGGSIPLAVLLALVACLLVAVSIGQLARHLPSAGGLYTFSSRGLHPYIGFLVAWGFMLAEPLVAPLLYLIFGNELAANLTSHFGWPTWLWAPFAVAAGLIVWGLTYRGIRLSTRTGVALGTFEIVVFLALALTLIIAAGGNNTLSVFGPHTGNPNGWGSVFPGMIFAILAFIGFEASLPLAEEVKEPRKTIPRAVFLSALLIGLFYLFCYYAATVYFGPNKMVKDFIGFNGGDPWSGMAQAVWGPGLIIVILAVLNSAIANSNAGANAATRVGYSLARIGLLPQMLQRVHPQFRTPYVAVNVQAIGGIVLAVGLGLVAGGALPAFALLGTVATIIVVTIYILTNLSNLVFYLRERRDEFNLLWNGIVPVVGSLIFLPALIAALGIDFAGLGISPLLPPTNLAPLIIGIWMLAGIALLIYFAARKPERIAETGRVFLDEAEATR